MLLLKKKEHSIYLMVYISDRCTVGAPSIDQVGPPQPAQSGAPRRRPLIAASLLLCIFNKKKSQIVS